MKNYKFKFNEAVRVNLMVFGIINPICRIKGVASIDQPFIGTTYIVEFEDDIPDDIWENYPFSCFAVSEILIQKLEYSKPDDFKDVHTEHCCLQHKRCKYGKEDTCTVCQEIALPSYPCNCDWC